MPRIPKKLIGAASDLVEKAAELAGRLVREEDDTTTPPPSERQPSPAPDAVGAPKPGAPGAPKSATAGKPKAKAKAKPAGRAAKGRATVEPPQAANAAAATPTQGPVATGKAKPKPLGARRKP